MKKLFIVRHAKSSWAFENLSDHDRPLNARGKIDAPDMAQRLQKAGFKPHLILTSSARRALDTARIFAETLHVSEANFKITPDLYHAGADKILKILGKLHENEKNVMLFGHNPGLTDLANQIGSFQLANLPTCGIYAVSFTEYWDKIGTSEGKLVLYDFPKNKS